MPNLGGTDKTAVPIVESSAQSYPGRAKLVPGSALWWNTNLEEKCWDKPLKMNCRQPILLLAIKACWPQKPGLPPSPGCG